MYGKVPNETLFIAPSLKIDPKREVRSLDRKHFTEYKQSANEVSLHKTRNIWLIFKMGNLQNYGGLRQLFDINAVQQAQDGTNFYDSLDQEQKAQFDELDAMLKDFFDNLSKDQQD